MKIRHLNGVKVCTVEDKINDFVAVYDYNKIVKTLYRIFREAEISDSSDPGRDHDPMNVVLAMLAGSHDIKEHQISTRENQVIYDDEQALKTKAPKFKLPKLTLNEIKLKQLLADKKTSADKIKTLENKLLAAEAQIKALTNGKKNIQDLPQTTNPPAFKKKCELKIIPGGKMIH